MLYDIDKIKEIEVETVCELYGIDLRKRGQNLWGKIRNEKTESFSINPTKNIWRDWGRAEGGDVISLVAKLESKSYAEAIKILGSRFNIPTEDKFEEYRSLPTPNQFKQIDINSTRVSLNLDINIENNTLEEVESMYSDKKYSLTMYELSKIDKELYHQIIDTKTLYLIERDTDTFVDINKKYKKETGKIEKILYKDMLEELEIDINSEIDIYNKSRLDGKELNRFKVKFEPEIKKIEVEDLISKIEKSVEEYTETPEQLKEYMKFMSKFHKYSVSNNFLMQSQFTGASAVGSFKFWKDKGFSVNKGEKAIKILVPNKVSTKFLDENGKLKPLSKAGEKEKEKVKKGELEISEKLYFSIGNIFDISQTNAKAEDLPDIFPNKWLEGNVKDHSVLYKGLENIAKSIDVKIIEPKSELGVSKGCSYTLTREVALNPRNSELQNFKTLLHELAHAKLHNAETHTKYTSAEKEFQAELTAFTVCSYFKIDTSEYSLNYLNHWSKGEIRDKQELLKEVNSTVKEYIGILEETLINEKEIINMKGKEELLGKEELIQNNELGDLFNGEKADKNIFMYYKEAEEEYKTISTLDDLKDFVVDYMGTFFDEDITNENESSKSYKENTFENDVRNNWNEKNFLEWCETNDITVSLEKPLEKEIVKKIKDDSSELTEDKFIYSLSNSINLYNVTTFGDVKTILIENYTKLFRDDIKMIEEYSKSLENISERELLSCCEMAGFEVKHELPEFEKYERNDISKLLSTFIDDENEFNTTFKASSLRISNDNNPNDYIVVSAYDYSVTYTIYKDKIEISKMNSYDYELPYDLIKDVYKISDIRDLSINVENPLKHKELKEDIHQKVNVKDKEAVSEMISALKEKEIVKKIKDHEEWIKSKGTRGSQLNLENENIRGMKFLDVDLRNSNMKNTDLRDCVFFADLRGANLTGAKIENSKFTGSNLGKVTIEANKLNLIEYQIEQEGDKHKWANKNLSTNVKRQKLEKE